MTDTTHTLIRSCPLCQSNLGSNLGSLCYKVFDNSPITGNVSLVICDVCGFAYNDTPDSQAHFDRYYQQNAYYFTATTAGSGGENPLELMRFESLYQRLDSYIPGATAAIFDVGCARGGLLNIFARHGYTNLFGVDLLPECVEYVKGNLGVHAELGSAFELPFSEVHADVLIYSHVVEHVINLSGLVVAAHEKLSNDGILYVEVPDASRYGEYTINPYQDLYLEHVNHFDLSTLVALFGAGGFEVVNSGRYELVAHPTGKVPCIWAIFRKGSLSLEKPDKVLEQHLREYMLWSRQHPAHGRFAELAKAKTPLYLWGISQYAMLIMGQTALASCNLLGFVDKDPYKRMRTLLGHPIESPEILRYAEPGCAVLVTAPGYEISIVSSLGSMNYRSKILNASGELIRAA